jgi:hypothetical protein
MEWGMLRALIAPASPLLSVILAVAVLPTAVNQHSVVAAVAVAAFAVLSCALILGRAALPSTVASSAGPVADTRCLRGAFRRQTSPDTPGRPRPRAPGAK